MRPADLVEDSRQHLEWWDYKSRIVRRVTLNDLVPPSLLMYKTTMALSHIRRTTRDLSWGRNWVTLRNTAFISNRFICWLACCGDHVPCSVREPSCAPIRDWRHLWIKLSLSLGHSVKPLAAPKERPTKPPDGEWSGSLKSCLTRTPSPGTIPLTPTTGLGGGVVDLLAMNVNIPKSLWRSLADISDRHFIELSYNVNFYYVYILCAIVLDSFVSGWTPPASFWVAIYIVQQWLLLHHPQTPEREAASFSVCAVDVHMYPSSCTRAV